MPHCRATVQNINIFADIRQENANASQNEKRCFTNAIADTQSPHLILPGISKPTGWYVNPDNGVNADGHSTKLIEISLITLLSAIL